MDSIIAIFTNRLSLLEQMFFISAMFFLIGLLKANYFRNNGDFPNKKPITKWKQKHKRKFKAYILLHAGTPFIAFVISFVGLVIRDTLKFILA